MKLQERQDRLVELLEREQAGKDLSVNEKAELNRLAKRLKVKLPRHLKVSHLLRKAIILNVLIISMIVGGVVWAAETGKEVIIDTKDYSANNRPYLSGSPEPQAQAASTAPSPAPQSRRSNATTPNSPSTTPYQAPNFEYTPYSYSAGNSSTSNSCESLRTSYANQYQTSLTSENQRYISERSQINSAISRLNNSGAGDSSAMNQFLAMQASNESRHTATVNQLYNNYQSQLASLSC